VLNPEDGRDRLRNMGPYSDAAFRAVHRDGLPDEAWRDETRDGRPLRVYSRPLIRDGRAVAVLQMAIDTGDIDSAVAALTRVGLLGLPVALLLAGAGGALLTDRALRPVRALTAAASRIEAQRLSDRLPVTGDDEFGRLAAVLNGMLARLEAAFARERRFAADASHELRTPLATIKAASSLALEDAEDAAGGDGFVRESLAEIDSAADRATRIIGDLLMLARAGTLPVRAEPVRVRDLLRAAADSSLRNARARGVAEPARLAVDADPELTLRTDADHLTRLATNLIDNALRHTPPGGTVAVYAHALPGGPGGGAAEITVADTGEGIAAEHLARLGEPFYRPDPARSRKTGGNGLGLALCHGLARALGGELRITSELGRGTTVTISLPAAPPSEAAAFPVPLGA
jgi:signal transduction histidine kinase